MQNAVTDLPPPKPPPRPGTKAHLSNLLALADVKFSAKDNLASLRLKCEEHGLWPPAPRAEAAAARNDEIDGDTTRTVQQMRVIKCSLRRALATLADDEYNCFAATVREYVELVSKMLRRASLVMNYHFVKLMADDKGGEIPNLMALDDTAWKNWLRLGLGQTDKKSYFPSTAVQQTFQELKLHLGRLPCDVAPANFDQVLAYAATLFATVVTNNAWVPLFSRLARLVKVKLKQLTPAATYRGIKAYHVLKVLRAANFDAEGSAYHSLPEPLQNLIAEVRQRLGAEPTECLHDTWAKDKDFGRLFRFNHWMATSFQDAEERRNRLTPIFRVQADHIRLDTKSLIGLLSQAFPQHKEVLALKAYEHWHAKDVKEPRHHGYTNPDKFMLPTDHKPSSARSAKKDGFPGGEEAWRAHKDAWQRYDALVAGVRCTQAYLDQKAKHDRLVQLRSELISAFFSPRLRTMKGGFAFDGSLVTDGVATSLQYSRTVAAPSSAAAKKKTSAQKKKEVTVADEYDRRLPTFIEAQNCIVLGLDPGRTNIATLACVTYHFNERTQRVERVKHAWKLSRGRYYHESGTVWLNRQLAQRQADLKEHWNAMMGNDCGLCSVVPSDILNYMEQYSAIEEQWWAQALAPVEVAATFLRYVGKRRVIDGFFAASKKQVQKAYPGCNIKVAYGSAYSSMKPTGRGEVAAPVSEAFRACCRVFGPDAVNVTDEYCTTKVDWATGEEKEMAYKILEAGPDGGLRELLRHTANKLPPVAATPEHRAAVLQYQARKRHQENRRRGGGNDGFKARGAQTEEIRYPEVRGLRFNKKLRMFCDRDLDSALAIGRLLVMELLKMGRPRPFCRGLRS